MASYKNRVSAIFFMADIFVITLCLATAIIIIKTPISKSVDMLDIGLWLFLTTGWYFTDKLQLNSEFQQRNFVLDLLKALHDIFFQGVFVVLFLFALRSQLYQREFVLIYLILLSFFIPVQHYILNRYLIHYRKSGKSKRNMVIIGAGSVGLSFHKLLQTNPQLGYHVVGFLDDQPKPSLNGQYLGTIDELQSLLDGSQMVDEIIVALPNKAADKISQVMELANNATVRLRIIPDYFQFLSSKYGVDQFGGFPIITVRHEPLEEVHWQMVKRLFDLFVSIFAIIFILSWLFPIIAICIKLNSKGPVLFTQQRSGLNNIPFNCLKFRSMYVNNDANSVQARKNDSRITSVGRFLRKSNLDEFPQFFNVLTGNMSIVGPRPHMVKHTDQYSKIIRQYLVRQLLKPGITGWAQVNGYRGETRDHQDMQKRVECDLWYLENWTLALDVKIIFLTVWNTVRGDEKAY